MSGGHGWIPSAALAESSRRWERFRSAVLARNCCNLAGPSSNRFCSALTISFTNRAGPSLKRATSTIFLAAKVCTSASAVWTSAVCSLYVFCSADQGLAVYWRSRDSARDRGSAPCSERLASGRRRCRADLRGGLVGVREERLEVLPALVAPEERQLGLRHDLREALD